MEDHGMSSQSELSPELQRRPLTRGVILRVKARSLRQGHWFRVLKGHERGLVDATVRWVNTIRSKLLEQIMTAILSKLTGSLVSRLAVLSERGRYMATRMSELAVCWGNNSAWVWRIDDSFRRSL